MFLSKVCIIMKKKIPLFHSFALHFTSTCMRIRLGDVLGSSHCLIHTSPQVSNDWRQALAYSYFKKELDENVNVHLYHRLHLLQIRSEKVNKIRATRQHLLRTRHGKAYLHKLSLIMTPKK